MEVVITVQLKELARRRLGGFIERHTCTSHVGDLVIHLQDVLLAMNVKYTLH
jgi:hypothetical protein